MSEILGYKFYLNFKNEGGFGRLEITECVGFDGSGFVVERDSKRYGRDVYKFNEEINLSFYKGFFDTTDTTQQLPNGTVVHNLSMGFDWLVETKKEFGFESNVDFEIEKNGVLFIPSNLDFQTSESDDFTYFTCKAVQLQDKQLINRRADIVTDIFSTEDLDGNPVTPAVTQNILLRAKPERQISKWEYQLTTETLQNFGGQTFAGFPLFNNLTDSGIEQTLTPFSTSYLSQLTVGGTAFLQQYWRDITIIKADFDLTDVVIKIRDLTFNSSADSLTNVKKTLSINHGFDYTAGDFETIILEETTDDSFSVSNQDYDIIIPFIPAGGFLFINYTMLDSFTGSYAPQFRNMFFTLTSGTLDITATSTAIDSVIKGVRYVDVFKENVKRINGFEVFAPRYDVGGEYYDQYAFTGNLIKQRDDVPFPVKFKERMNDLMELHSDYQIINKVYIGQYPDFYPNYEIGVFVTPPDETFKSTFNERYAINQFEISYDTYEQDRDESNTTDAIHTESQWLPSNKQVENTKEIKIKLIRDAYKIESLRKLGLKDTTSTTDDDKLIVIDVVALAPSSFGGFTSVLAHNVDSNGNLQLRNTDLFVWTLLGFSLGDLFAVAEGGENSNIYTVIELTDSIITLSTEGDPPTFIGETFTEVTYPYSSVSLVNRTDEGLDFFDNLIEGDNYSNLRYSIKRNMKTWFPYLATASKFDPNGTFRNTYFKDNGECITRFTGEPENIQENANVLNVDLGDAILTPYMFETRLVAPYNDALSFLIANDTINPDNTIGGFARCIDNNGRVIKLYSAKFDYLPSTEVLRITGEQRYEGDNLVITLSGGQVVINEVGYDLVDLADVWYEFDGDYLKIYDTNGLPVINPTKYNVVVVNGLTFGSAIDLMNYLTNN